MPKGVYKKSKKHLRNLSKSLEGNKLSKETKKKISQANKGKIRTIEFKNYLSKISKGRKFSEQTRKKLSKAIKGEKNGNWKNGISSKNERIREGIEYRLWRESVFARDNWTCQKTKIRGEILHPHHIKNFSDYPELRFAINNGITLSEKAHREFHKKYGFKNNTKKQIKEFLKK